MKLSWESCCLPLAALHAPEIWALEAYSKKGVKLDWVGKRDILILEIISYGYTDIHS